MLYRLSYRNSYAITCCRVVIHIIDNCAVLGMAITADIDVK